MENENKRGEFIVCPECKSKYDVQTEFCTFCGCLLEKKEENLSDKLEKAYNQAYNETTDKRPMNYKKIGIIAAVVVCIAIIVTVILSNSKHTGTPMNKIKADIGELPVVTEGVIECLYTPFSSYKVDSVEIDKRQTNVEDKEDIVYCNVGISNEYYQTELQIKLVYNYYDDGGWILDEHETVRKTTVPLRGIDYKMLNIGSYKRESCEEWVNPTLANYTISQETDLTNGVDVVYIESPENNYTVYSSVTFTFDQKYGWQTSNLGNDSIAAVVYDIKLDYDALIGTFYYYKEFGGAFFSKRELKITSYNKDTNMIEGQYIYQNTYSDDEYTAKFKAPLDTRELSIEFDTECTCGRSSHYGHVESETLWYDFDNDCWGERDRAWYQGKFYYTLERTK
ncbi:MAG: hypothetical protein E7531_00050 [Ruminococcaceae bacterium]|nr:hypothetical protein [Oscillospiraceae bacterium]